MSLQLTFLGGAGTVTGSCFRIVHPRGRFLVDCGLFQGSKTVKELNYGAFPFDPRQIDFVLLTHAHIDHSGLLPKLTKSGFAGRIVATEGTRDLLEVMLPDSAVVQESEVERLNRRNARRGSDPVHPIYTGVDATRCLERLSPIAYDRWFEPGPGVRARFWNAGHILGSASIEIQLDQGPAAPPLRMLFSGDIGPEHKLFHPDPAAPADVDYVVCEATYGDTRRPPVSADVRRRLLGEEIKLAFARGGNLLIPCFAVERTQELLHDLAALFDQGTLSDAPIFVDSPLAIRATETFMGHADRLEDVSPENRLFRHRNFRFAETVEESKAIARISGGAVIIAGSGMCDAGRIRHHLKENLWRHEATILLVGYQAEGTLGALLVAGKTKVRIHGDEIEVRATVRRFDAYSGHADQAGLSEWVRGRLPIRRGLFLVHGEGPARLRLRERLNEEGVPSRRVVLPELDDTFDLSAVRPPVALPGARRLDITALSGLDWHNDYAQFLLDLRQQLSTLAGARARRALLRRLTRAIRSAESERIARPTAKRQARINRTEQTP